MVITAERGGASGRSDGCKDDDDDDGGRGVELGLWFRELVVRGRGGWTEMGKMGEGVFGRWCWKRKSGQGLAATGHWVRSEQRCWPRGMQSWPKIDDGWGRPPESQIRVGLGL